MGRLVQSSPVARTDRQHSAGRTRDDVSSIHGSVADGGLTQTRGSPENPGRFSIARACGWSLSRLGTDHLDLYLLHFPVPSEQFSGVVAAFEQLRAAGKIRAWGVSNFNVGQMEELFRVPDGHRCATNQVPYSLHNRRIERDVLPWCKEHNLPVMAYSPLGGDNNLVVGDRTLAQVGATRGCSASAVALAWVIRSGSVIAIPEY